MLFSNDQVAQFINRNFEPTWEMVREVPILRIDFGHGNVLTRTLHGNILTSVCTADGKTLDSLPGIYNPTAYLDQLDQFRLLAQNVNRVAATGRDAWVRAYHQRQAERIAKNQTVERFIEAKKIVPVGKMVIEMPAQRLLVNSPPAAVAYQPNSTPVTVMPRVTQTEELAGWKALADDAKLNETTRRRQIHELLAKEGLVSPSKALKPIYKDVLHADLDDPYLGLGAALVRELPLQPSEDAKR